MGREPQSEASGNWTADVIVSERADVARVNSISAQVRRFPAWHDHAPNCTVYIL